MKREERRENGELRCYNVNYEIWLLLFTKALYSLLIVIIHL